MSSLVGIVINTSTMQIARIVLPTTDSGLSNEIIGPGERLVTLSTTIYQNLQTRNDIAAYLGLAG